MQKRDKSRFSPPALGGSSLLVVFAVLCLTVFALLGLSTVRADGRLAEAATEAVSAYYRADAEAQEILARLRSGTMPEGVQENNGIYAFTCAISETQQLEVQVRVEGGGYNVLRWQAAPTEEWETDGHLTVWDGE